MNTGRPDYEILSIRANEARASLSRLRSSDHAASNAILAGNLMLLACVAAVIVYTWFNRHAPDPRAYAAFAIPIVAAAAGICLMMETLRRVRSAVRLQMDAVSWELKHIHRDMAAAEEKIERFGDEPFDWARQTTWN